MFSHQSKQNHLVQFLQELEPGSEVKITNTHISAVIGIVKSQKGIWGLAKCVFTEHTLQRTAVGKGAGLGSLPAM